MYRDFNHKDKTVMRLSYLSNGNSYIAETVSLYWGSLQIIFLKHFLTQ